MSRLLAVLMLSSSLALATPGDSLPAGYKVQKTVVSGTREIVLATRTLTVNSRVVPGDKTLSDSTLVTARDSRSDKMLWKRWFPRLLKLDGANRKTVEVSSEGTFVTITHYSLSAQTGKILQSSKSINLAR